MFLNDKIALLKIKILKVLCYVSTHFIEVYFSLWEYLLPWKVPRFRCEACVVVDPVVISVDEVVVTILLV